MKLISKVDRALLLRAVVFVALLTGVSLAWNFSSVAETSTSLSVAARTTSESARLIKSRLATVAAESRLVEIDRTSGSFEYVRWQNESKTGISINIVPMDGFSKVAISVYYLNSSNMKEWRSLLDRVAEIGYFENADATLQLNPAEYGSRSSSLRPGKKDTTCIYHVHWPPKAAELDHLFATAR